MILCGQHILFRRIETIVFHAAAATDFAACATCLLLSLRLAEPALRPPRELFTQWLYVFYFEFVGLKLDCPVVFHIMQKIVSSSK